MSSTAIRVVLVGRKAEMGRIVADNLKPEVEVIHFISTPESAMQDLPLMLNDKKPSNVSAGNIGSQMYSQPPDAILLGLGYNNEVVDQLREACKSVRRGIPWLTGGLSQRELEDMLETNPPPPPEKGGPMTALRMKANLQKLLDEGKGGQDGLFIWYQR